MSSLLTPLLWSFIPSQLTTVLLPYLTAYFPQIFPAAPKGTQLYRRNYRITYSLLVLGYLIWIFVPEAQSGEDWYRLLGIGRSVDDEGLKRAFRTLSRRHHPDRSDGDGDLFIRIRQAYEVLTDPTRRYAYDRFGPDIIHWKSCKTVKEFIYSGLTHSIGFYIISGGMMVALSLLRKATHGAYWRQTLFAILLYLELSLILSPTPTPHTIPFVPHLLYPIIPKGWYDIPQFIWVQTFHQVWTSLSIGITQLAGIWSDDETLGDEKEAMIRLAGLARSLEMEIVTQFQGEVIPFLQGPKNPVVAERALLAEMEEILIDRTLSTQPGVQNSWQAGVRRHMFRSPVLSSQRDVEVARRIPLPPSPPPSPRPQYKQVL